MPSSSLTDSDTMARLRADLAVADQLMAGGRSGDAVEILERLHAAGAWPGEISTVLTHNLATALRQRAAEALSAGEPATAAAVAAKVLEVPVPPELPVPLLRGRADILAGLGTSFMHAGHLEHALLCFRQAIALYPCPTFSINLISTLARLGSPSVLADYCDALAPKDLAPRILLACQPKSGSTFLRNVLQEVTGWREIYLCHHTEMSAQDLFYPILLEYADVPTVTHQHCRATEANLQLMQAFGIRPVVLVRNLFDVVVSLRDFYNGGAVRATQFEEAAWNVLTPEQQADFLIDLVVPWHLEFLASWQKAARARRVPLLFLTYAEMIRDKPAAVRRILTFYGIAADDVRIAAAIAAVEARPERNRFNQGIAGRGREGLTEAQKARIRQLARYFPETDFTEYGLAG